MLREMMSRGTEDDEVENVDVMEEENDDDDDDDDVEGADRPQDRGQHFVQTGPLVAQKFGRKSARPAGRDADFVRACAILCELAHEMHANN